MVQPWDKQYQYLLFAAEPYESLLSRLVQPTSVQIEPDFFNSDLGMR
jgi:hypothetical protein